MNAPHRFVRRMRTRRYRCVWVGHHGQLRYRYDVFGREAGSYKNTLCLYWRGDPAHGVSLYWSLRGRALIGEFRMQWGSV